MKKTLLFVAALASMAMNVFAASEVITFDINQPSSVPTLEFNEKNVWTETYNTTDYAYIEFNESNFMFSHIHHGTIYENYYYGFTPAAIYDANTTQYESCYAKGGAKGENTPYMVGFYSAWDNGSDGLSSTHILFPQGQYVKSAKFALTAKVVDAVTNPLGDGMAGSRPFAKGDYFYITVTPLDESYQPMADKAMNIYMVDYRAENEADWVFTKDWKEFDLSALGFAGGLNFSVMSSVGNAYGPTTPSYFCIDELQVSSTPISTDVEEAQVAPVKAYAQNGVLNILYEGPVAVYDLAGVQVFAAELNGETAQVALNAGIYVVRAGEQAVKVQVR